MSASTILVLFFALSSIPNNASAYFATQCQASNGTQRMTANHLEPPVVPRGPDFEPVEIKVIFDIWDIHRVDDETQTLFILSSLTVYWTDPRLKAFCKYFCTLCSFT